MISKIYDKVKKFIKENYKEILFLIAFYLFMTYPLPYYISVSGGTIDVGDRLVVEGAYKEKGSFNLAYVTELKSTIPTYLLSYIIPSWERVSIGNYQISEEESMEELVNRDILYLNQASQSAIYVAYTKANKTFDITDHHYYVYYADDRASSDILVGDELIGFENIDALDLDKLKDVIDSKKVGDNILLKLKRGNKTLDVKTSIYEEEGIKYIGIMFFDLFDYKLDPSLELKFENGESGPSGGLTLSLAIYNKLVEEDITRGLKIVGTGTIDVEGNVGEIGGVKYKLMGAVKSKADVFLVPTGSNYDECIKLKKEKNYDIEIIGVSTFDEALQKLSEVSIKK